MWVVVVVKVVFESEFSDRLWLESSLGQVEQKSATEEEKYYFIIKMNQLSKQCTPYIYPVFRTTFLLLLTLNVGPAYNGLHAPYQSNSF